MAMSIKFQLTEANRRAESYRRSLVKIGMRTQCRDVYDIAVEALGVKRAVDLARMAKEMGVE